MLGGHPWAAGQPERSEAAWALPEHGRRRHLASVRA